MQSGVRPCEITRPDIPSPMLRSALVCLALLSLSACTFEGRTDGGDPLHTDNGALEAHREAVSAAVNPEIIEPLGDAPAYNAAPVPTPQSGTAYQNENAPQPENSAANSGALATPPVPVPGGGQTPAGTRTSSP